MATVPRSLIADEAAVYVSLGWKVLFLSEATKLPIPGSHGYKDATDDAELIDRHSRQFPRANIGVPTGKPSELLIVDVDKRNGGFASVKALESQGFVFDACPVSKTGNDGRHYWYALKPGESFPSSNGRLDPGIDVKGDGGYVVAPPSWVGRTEAGPGGRYEWIVHPTEIRPPPLPVWLRDKLVRKRKPVLPTVSIRPSDIAAQRRLDALARTVASAKRGERNNVLNWAAYRAGEMVWLGQASADIVNEALWAAGRAAGLPDWRIGPTLRSGLGAALHKGGGE
jgi:hypothetical protein